MMMQRKKRMACMFIVIFGMITLCMSFAEDVYAESEPKVLVIYSSKEKEIDENQRTLDMLLGHFTTDITFKHSEEVQEKDLKNVTHLFYYGQIAEKLPPTFVELFDQYTGYFVALGYNSEQLGDKFSFIEPQHEVVVDQIVMTNNKEKSIAIAGENSVDINVVDGEVLISGREKGTNREVPIGVKKGKNIYITFDNIAVPKSYIIGEVFYEVFQKEHTSNNLGFIRLEDIHPLVNPQHVQDITDRLYEKNIPFMMAVIPVYTNPDTGKKHHFSDSPKLLKVLKEAQKKGGSIVLHGYTHQFRDSETGEGFEFWDVEHNTPIYAEAHKHFELKEEADFQSASDYEAYMNKLIKFESDYIHSKITKGVQELTNLGLYPLAFEAPHYTMSQNGYRLLSEHFSTYVGQVQLSDQDWEIMSTTPYVSKPTFLHGMELIPETLGYVRPDDQDAVKNIMKKSQEIQSFEDGLLGVFYHPYLGISRFEELLGELEKLPNVSWIDLKQMDTWVKVDNVFIHSKDGEVVTEISRSGLLLSSIDYPMYHLQRFIDVVVWGIAVVGTIAVLIFIGFTLYQSTRRMKIEG